MKSASLLLALAWALPAAAGPRRAPYQGLFVDVAQGVAVGVGDHEYLKLADPSYKLQLRGGWAFEIAAHFRLGPELTFDFVPINSNDDTFDQQNTDANLYRVRALFGARAVVPFGVGAFFLRLGFGLDHLWGTTRFRAPLAPTQSYSSTAFGFDPGVGIHFDVVRNLVLGLSVDFPMAGHDLGANRSVFTAVDCDLLFFAGARY